MEDINPVFSIIIPVYNRADFIIETLQSIADQSYNHWECLVIDDFSTDCTSEIVSNFIGLQNGTRFKLFTNQRSKGAQGARNTGLDLSSGSLLVFLDSDDLLAKNCLEKRLKFIEYNQGYQLYCFPTLVFNKIPYDSNYLWNYLNTDVQDLERFLEQDMPWHTTGPVWRKSLLLELKGWDESLLCWQDWDMHIRALMHPGLKYLKATDTVNNIDSFYRLNDCYESIVNHRDNKLHVENKMQLIEKTSTAINLLNNTQIDLAFARLTYRIAQEAVPHFGQLVAKQYLLNVFRKTRLSRLFIFLWVGYLRNLSNQEQNRGFRRIYNLAPRIYASRHLLSKRSTHLKATYLQ
jgi:glycosyltransferase involved in cell wall biosynthesis